MNDGQRVEQYLSYVKLPIGNPWCAAFVCWALGSSGVDDPGSGWSPDLFPLSRLIWQRSRTVNPKRLKLSENKIPQSGDVFGIYFPDRGRIAHCGFIDQWGKWVITVEGNTNISGSRKVTGCTAKEDFRARFIRLLTG